MKKKRCKTERMSCLKARATMKANEFIVECFNRGICRKKRAEKYVSDKPVDYDYTEKDFEAVFSLDDTITNGERYWANHISGDDECELPKAVYWAREAEHVPIRRKEVRE
jgi:hypothetical protein